MENEIIKIEENSSYIAPVANIGEALERYHEFGEFVSKILKKDTDYGEIPGTNKPTLLKAGAEKLGTFFGLRPLFSILDNVDDWTGKEHNGEPFFYRQYKCQLYRNGELVGEGVGSCNSWEKKYRYRWISEMEVPASIDKSKLDYTDGTISEFAFAVEKAETSGKYGKPAEYWQRFKDAIANGTAKQIKRKTKKGDEMDAWEIGGKLYAVPNKDVADQVNTIDKMAQKRAFVAAILIATNASDYFTQDMEDFSGDVMEGEIVEETKPQKATVKNTVEKKTNTRPYEPEMVKEKIEEFASMFSKSWDEETLAKKQTAVVINLELCYAGEGADMKRHEAMLYLVGVAHKDDLTASQTYALLRWLAPRQDSGGAWSPDPMAVREAQTLLTVGRKDAGQQELFEGEEG